MPRLDFGTTFTDNQPILDVVRDNGGATLSLTLAAFIIALRHRASRSAWSPDGCATPLPTC